MKDRQLHSADNDATDGAGDGDTDSLLCGVRKRQQLGKRHEGICLCRKQVKQQGQKHKHLDAKFEHTCNHIVVQYRHGGGRIGVFAGSLLAGGEPVHSPTPNLKIPKPPLKRSVEVKYAPDTRTPARLRPTDSNGSAAACPNLCTAPTSFMSPFPDIICPPKLQTRAQKSCTT